MALFVLKNVPRGWGGRSGTRADFLLRQDGRAVPVIKVGAGIGDAANLGDEIAVVRGLFQGDIAAQSQVHRLQLSFPFDLRIEVVHSEFRSHRQPIEGRTVPFEEDDLVVGERWHTGGQEWSERRGRAGVETHDNGVGDFLVAERRWYRRCRPRSARPAGRVPRRLVSIALTVDGGRIRRSDSTLT